MSITATERRSTGQLVDEWAHEAGVVDKDHHVTGSTATKSGAALHAERHAGGTKGEAAGGAAIGVAKEVLPEVMEHVATKGWSAAGFAAAGVFVGGLGYLAYEYLHELSAAEKKADEIRGAFDNDAVNVALARSLDFHPAFGELEAANRPGVNQAAGKLSQKLSEPNERLKSVLQARADEGFEAARRADAATRHLPPAERQAAIATWMKDNGFADRLANDVAFGKGVEYFAWIHADGARALGVSPEVECAKVEGRRVPPQPTRIAG